MFITIINRFTSGNFLKASQIIRSIKNPNPSPKDDRRPIFWSDEERILTYELTVAILKYSNFLQEALEKSQFYLKYPQLQNVGKEELLVILYDLMEREFRVSQEDTPLPEAFAKLQNAILSSKTKLMAHIAKLRIKHEATVIENLLPTNLRQKQNIDKNPLYIWINLKKAGISKVVSALMGQGLKETCFEDDTLIQENLFSLSRIHPDLIRLHSSKNAIITSLPIFRDGSIVVQDKSACLPVYVLAKALFFKEALNHRGVGMEHLNPFPKGGPYKKGSIQDTHISAISNDFPSETPKVLSRTSTAADDWCQGILDGGGKHCPKPDCIVITHCGSGRSAAHLAILLAEAVPRYLSKSTNMSTTGTNLEKAIKSKFVYRAPLNVVVFGTPQSKYEEIHKYLKKTLGVQNLRMYSDDFLTVTTKDARVKGCVAILVTPPSSGSALKDPVSYICSEGGDEQILAQFSQYLSSATTSRVLVDENGNKNTAFTPIQAKYLSHALGISNVKLILYTTCSNLTCENSDVVKACLNEARRREETRKCQIYASIVMQSQSKQYKDVSFDTVNLEKLMEGYEDEDNCFKHGFVDMQPSSACSGVFMALIRRRDRHINMAKNPVKQFVANQMKQWADGEDDDGLVDFVSPEISGNASLSNLTLKSFTEAELARYLVRKLNLEGGKPNNLADFSRAPSVMPVFQANMKKKASKKAIVKRVSTPTHSSMQRQTEKFSGVMDGIRGSSGGAGSNSASGTNTPRSGARTPDGRPSTSLSTSGGRGSSAGGNCPYHHLHQHGHVCVCARHAKKFPDMVKNL